MAHQPNGDNRDSAQVLKESYDPSLNRIRVDAVISDGTDAVIVNPDGSLNVNIRDRNGNGVVLGQQLGANSVPVVFASDTPAFSVDFPPDTIVGTIESGTVDTAYNEITSVPTSIETQIVAYTAVADTRMKIVEVSGTNIAAFTIYVNGTPIHKKRTYYGNLDNNFQFSKGYHLLLGDVVSVTVLHTQSTVGDFNGFILVLKDE